MDEATPHLHIDFVPYTTGSTRGLDTRVSLKKALSELGFEGGSKQDTEWNQWVESEKHGLSLVMERFGVTRIDKNEPHEHLSVLNYKREERAKEVAELNAQINELKITRELLSSYAAGIYHRTKCDIIPKVYHPFRRGTDIIEKSKSFDLLFFVVERRGFALACGLGQGRV